MIEDVTNKLNDIDLPNNVSWWPLATGWWILFLVAVVLLVLAWYWYQRVHLSRVRLLIRDARSLLDQAYNSWCANHNNQEFIATVSVLLRRLALSLYSRDRVAGVTGKAWLEFLDQGMLGRPFSNGVGVVLLEGPYQRNSECDLNLLYRLCCQKIKQLENGDTRV